MNGLLPDVTSAPRACRSLAAVLLAGAALASSAIAATTYQIIHLPLLPDMAYGTAVGINNAGAIIGAGYPLPGSLSRPVVWSAAPDYSPRWLPEGGALEISAIQINDAGYIIGRARFPGTQQLWTPVMWGPDDVLVRLGEVPGGQWAGSAVDINARGTSVGQVRRLLSNFPPPGIYIERAAVWVTPQLVLGLGGGRHGFGASEARALNDSGTVVGYGSVAPNVVHAFRWTPGGGIQDLGDPPGGADSSHAFDVNNAGEVVGVGESGLGTRALMWSADGSMLDLGELPGAVVDYDYYADSINNMSEVIGRFYDPNTAESEQFFWTAVSGMVRLDDLIGAAVTIFRAPNDAGVMIGNMNSGTPSLPFPIVVVPQP